MKSEKNFAQVKSYPNSMLAIYKQILSIGSPNLRQFKLIDEAEKNFYVKEEFIHGQNLYDYLNATELQDTEAYMLIIKILKAINILHQNMIYHGDIKLDNIIVTEDEQIVIISFEHAKIIPDHQTKLYYLNDIKNIGNIISIIAQSTSDDMVDIISKCYQLEPDHNYQNIYQIKSDIYNLIKLEKDRLNNLKKNEIKIEIDYHDSVEKQSQTLDQIITSTKQNRFRDLFTYFGIILVLYISQYSYIVQHAGTLERQSKMLNLLEAYTIIMCLLYIIFNNRNIIIRYILILVGMIVIYIL